MGCTSSHAESFYFLNNERKMKMSEHQAIMSAAEKRILSSIIPESEPLPYPTRILKMSVGKDTTEFIIPEEDKEKVLQELYPFYKTPKLTDIRYCLHEEEHFEVRDFKVIRDNNRNFLVSPFYAKSGGMVIDWMEREDTVATSFYTQQGFREIC